MRRLPTTAAMLAAAAVVAAMLLVSSPVATTLAAERTSVAPTTTTTTPPPPTTTTVTAPPAPVVAPEVLGQQVLAAAQSVIPGAKVGLLVVDTSTGTPVASLNAGQQFYSASVVKLLIAVDALSGAGWAPSQDTQNQLHQMLAYSDDDVADNLWDADGGNSIISRMIGQIGLTGTQPPDDPSEWGETLLTATDVVAIYHYITTVVPAPARAVVIDALRNAGQTAADGTNQYFGIPNGLPGVPAAIKQGWMDMYSETVLDTTGLVGPNLRYAVAMLTSLPAGTSWTSGGNALTAGITALKPSVTN